MPTTFNDETFTYTIDKQAIDDLAVKGASDSIARDAISRISVLLPRLDAAQISHQEFYEAMQRETKLLLMAEKSLAKGGIDQMRPEDWKALEPEIAELWNGRDGDLGFKGLRRFAEDIQNGRYGREQLGRAIYGGGPSFQDRALAYGSYGRTVYENERLRSRMGTELLEAKAITGATDTCVECTARANLGWIEAQRMLNEYPIGRSRCGANCYCVIVTRRAAVDEANAVGWNALPSVIGRVARTAAPVALFALGVFQFARTNPQLIRYALELLADALGARRTTR